MDTEEATQELERGSVGCPCEIVHYVKKGDEEEASMIKCEADCSPECSGKGTDEGAKMIDW